jgi:hypothetical protein
MPLQADHVRDERRPSESRRPSHYPTATTIQRGDRRAKSIPRREKPARSRLEVFESICREFRVLVDAREQRADDVVRTLGDLARRAAMDRWVASAAVCVAFLDGRRDQPDDFVQLRVEIIHTWFGEGWANG